jgi:branched-chain amino acid aminotransferase
MAGYVNINGKLVPASETQAYVNSAFRFGAGLFETILVLDGEIRLWQYHQSRLLNGMHILGFRLPKAWSEKTLEDHINDTIKQNSLSSARVRLQVFSEKATLDDHGETAFYIECREIDKSITMLNSEGWTLGFAEGLVKAIDKTSGLKTISALPYAIAAQQAVKNGWQDSLIPNSSGNIIETSIANIFWVTEDNIYTPPLSEGCIAGTMRRYVLDHLPDLGYRLTEQPLTKEILKSAKSVFTTNAIRRIKWIRSIDGTEYDIGIVVELANKLFT